MELIGHCKRQKRKEEAVSERRLVEEKEIRSSSSSSCLSLLQDDDDILIEILKRVSWKSAYRCKAVCKQWHSIISSRYFIARYKAYHRGLFSLKAHLKSFVVVQLHEYNPTAPKSPAFSLPSYPSGAVRFLKKIALDFVPTTPNFRIEATCQDLMLCRCCSSGAYFIVNPLVTRQCLLIPPPPNFIHNHPEINIFFRTGLLCLDGNNNNNNNNSSYCLRFKVIRIPTFLTDFAISKPSPLPPEWDLSDFRVHIFCSQTNKWTEFVVDWYPFKFNHYLSKTPIISHAGMFHWVNGHSVVCFNPDADINIDNHLKLSHTINLPVTLGIGSGSVLLGFGLCNGHLRMFTKSMDMIGEAQRALRVWELEDDHRMGGSWKLVHSVLHSSMPRIAALDRILAFHPYDGNIIFLYLDDDVCRLNLRTRRSKTYKVRKAHRRGNMLQNGVQPLLLQWFPTPLSSFLTDSSSIAPCHGQFGCV